MRIKKFLSLLLAVTGLGALSALAVSSPALTAGSKNLTVTVVDFGELQKARSTGAQVGLRHSTLSLTSHAPTSPVSALGADQEGNGLIPLWTFKVRAARDGLNHIGAMVGTNPFTTKQSSKIPTFIVPVILHTHSVGVSINGAGIITTVPGDTTVNPNQADNACLTAPNNVPTTLVRQSPIFDSASFTFGGTHVGTTQYIDAFQRANFFQALGNDADNYHVLLSPVKIPGAIDVDVPANEGLAFGPSLVALFGLCGPVLIIDINWWDSYINGTLLPQLAHHGVNPASLPVFFLYNTNMASPVVDLNTCCILGYHSFAGEPTPSQTYAVAEIDVSGLFIPSIENTAVLAHEIGEWANDPYGDNEVPPWGHVGQVGGCQENLEVGDPLTGTPMPPVTMPNGFTYQLQELAFFSWFFGGESVAVNGWFSNNNTFTTDAGAVCP